MEKWKKEIVVFTSNDRGGHMGVLMSPRFSLRDFRLGIVTDL